VRGPGSVPIATAFAVALLTVQASRATGAIGRDDEWVGARDCVQRAMAVPLAFEPGTDHGPAL